MRRKAWRVVQKPPYAYYASGLLFMLYLLICWVATALLIAIIGVAFLVGGWWLLERGSTYKKRQQAREAQTQRLEADDN